MQTFGYKVLASGVIISVVIWYFDAYHSEMFERKFSDVIPVRNNRITNDAPGSAGEKFFNREIIARFYEKSRGLLSTKWNSSDKIEQMISAISNASADGLNADDYHLNEIVRLIQDAVAADSPHAEDVNRIEFLLTDSFLLLSSHLSSGKTNPETIDPLWKVPVRREKPGWENQIDSALETGNISDILTHLVPRHPDYVYLKSALVKYRLFEEAGGWGVFTTSQPKLEYGMRHPDVASLRKRLAITQGYIKPDSADEDLFDQTLHDQLVIFQLRNGLDTDGVAGKATIEALNIPVEERIESIEANLERWRWIRDDLGEQYIWVNIANFKLRVMENDNPVFECPVIVGRQYRQTPVFGAVLKYLVINPDWVVPPTILKNDIMPDVMKDHSYLAKNNMKLLKHDGTEIDTSAIDWSKMSDKAFPYMIRQAPGPKNPLGRVKFVFPNEYDVYIHDTPSRSLFLKNIRTFSSGCIRISNAYDLAGYLLKDDPEWTLPNLKKAIDNGEKWTIALKNPVPVYVLYLTAWADADGTAYFGKDVYSRDRQLIAALKQIQP